MWQFARAVEGITAACKALDIPITGGNVSLYNETDGKAIYPTPVLGVVGLIEDASKVLGRSFKGSGDAIVLLGETRDELGGSEYLKVMQRVVAGVPPEVDLHSEKALQQLLVAAAREGLLRSAHDCAEGGLAVTLAECAFGTGGIGLKVDLASRCADAWNRSRRCFRNRRLASSSRWRASTWALCWTARRRRRAGAGNRHDRNRPDQRLNEWAERHRYRRERGRDDLG